MDLDPELSWLLEAVTPDCWTPPIEWQVGDGKIEIRLWPTGRLEGTFGVSEDAALPEDFEIALAWPPAATDPDSEPSQVRIPCSVGEAGWACDLPAGRHDLRLEPAGYSAQTLADVEIEAGKVRTLGAVELVEGARITGWVRAQGADTNEAEVHLEPAYGEASATGQRLARSGLARWTTTSDEQGRFELSGVPAGLYQARARREGFVSAPVEVEVAPGKGMVSPSSSLDLVPLSTLEVSFEPPLDPWGQPWEASLNRRIGNTGTVRRVAEGSVLPSGTWSPKPLEPGEYGLAVRDSQGGRWGSRPLELVGGPESLFWALDVVPVIGSVSLGDEPLGGVEVIWGPDAAEIRFPVNEEGRFEGWLPEERTWRVEIAGLGGEATQRPVEVRRRKGQRAAEVEIELPDTLLRGRVTAEGEPIRALVMALGEGEVPGGGGAPGRRYKAFDLVTDEEGRFEIVGLEPGRLEVTASARGLGSEGRVLELAEGQAAELEIDLRPSLRLRGRLTSPSGDMTGASLLAYPDSGLPLRLVASTGGRFELVVDSGASYVDLAVVPPVGSLFFRRLPLAGSLETERLIEAGSGAALLGLDDVLAILAASGGSRFFLFHDGVGIPADVLLERVSHRFAPHPSGGTALPPVAPGLWSLCPSPDPNHPDCERARLFDGAEVSFAGRPDAETASSGEP